MKKSIRLNFMKSSIKSIWNHKEGTYMEESKKNLSFTMPEMACNAHLHIIDPRFPNNGKAEAQKGTVEEYRKIAAGLHLDRAVFVQAKPFGCDNACLLGAIQEFGPERSVGIAVVHSTISDPELQDLHERGVRGLRFSVWNPQNAVVSFEECLPLAQRTADLGWNMQLHMSAAQLVERLPVIRELPGKVVIDHMGRLDPALGTEDPAYAALLELVERGNVWVKLSGPYLNTTQGYPWSDASATAKKLVQDISERLLWGTDYPHVTEKVKPSETFLTEMLADWIPTDALRRKILVENPEEVYGFAPAPSV
jgi:D-galactarolactone isomerase